MDLEQRLDRLESIEAIRRLKHTYCKLCDDGYDAAGIAALFWEDGVWDAGPDFGRYEGADAIARFFEGVAATIVWARHLVTNERIEVQGDDARGEFQILQLSTVKTKDGREQAVWLVGEYEDE